MILTLLFLMVEAGATVAPPPIIPGDVVKEYWKRVAVSISLQSQVKETPLYKQAQTAIAKVEEVNELMKKNCGDKFVLLRKEEDGEPYCAVKPAEKKKEEGK